MDVTGECDSIAWVACRSASRAIAKRLGIHPTTLMQRVRNLEKQDVVRGYRANVDYMKLGYEFMAIVHIYVEGDLMDVQKRIKDLKNVVAVLDVTGECDSIAWVACRSREEFSQVVKSMLTIPGVKKTNTYVILNVIKDPFNFLPDFSPTEQK